MLTVPVFPSSAISAATAAVGTERRTEFIEHYDYSWKWSYRNDDATVVHLSHHLLPPLGIPQTAKQSRHASGSNTASSGSHDDEDAAMLACSLCGPPIAKPERPDSCCLARPPTANSPRTTDRATEQTNEWTSNVPLPICLEPGCSSVWLVQPALI